MTLDEAIKHAEETARELEYSCNLWKRLADEKVLSLPTDYEPCKKCAEENRQLAKWLIQLKQVRDLVQEYSDKEIPEKICDEGDGECWGVEATTLLGKIADILKIDRCEEANND